VAAGTQPGPGYRKDIAVNDMKVVRIVALDTPQPGSHLCLQSVPLTVQAAKRLAELVERAGLRAAVHDAPWPAENVTVYLADGGVERFENVTRERAAEIELTLGSSPNIMRIDVEPAN
jgi:hypothetical protein